MYTYMYIYIYTYIYINIHTVYVYIYMYIYIYLPDPSNHGYSLPGKYISNKYFIYSLIQILTSCSEDLFSKIQQKSDPPHKIMRYFIYYST